MHDYRPVVEDKLEHFDNTELAKANMLDDALIVISNLIARASTKWTIEETKLFLCAVSRIKTRDEDNWVTISKKDIQEKLDITPQNGTWLREAFRKVVKKSFVQIDGATEDEWHDGFLLYSAKSTRKDISVRFNESFIPLLDQLSMHFTEFYLDYVKDFKRLSSYKLYVYLCSWADHKYQDHEKKIAKKDIPKVFGLSEDEYWRDYGTDKARFHWADFEKRCLNPAIEEINSLTSCDMHILSCDKVRHQKKDGTYSREILGYDIWYTFVDEDGFRK